MRSVARHVTVVVAVLCGGCAEDVTVVALELTNDDCTAASLADVKMLSVDVYGTSPASDAVCNLKKRCVDVLDPPTSIEDLAELLREQERQPLIDTQLSGAATINIVGRREAGSCFKAEEGGYPVCGVGDLGNVVDGVLEIHMRCGECVAEAYEQCP